MTKKMPTAAELSGALYTDAKKALELIALWSSQGLVAIPFEDYAHWFFAEGFDLSRVIPRRFKKATPDGDLVTLYSLYVPRALAYLVVDTRIDPRIRRRGLKEIAKNPPEFLNALRATADLAGCGIASLFVRGRVKK